MRTKFWAFTTVTVIGAALFLATGTDQAWATTCNSAFTAANGTTTLPGTDIGTVAAGCEIGQFDTHQGQNSGPGVVNTSGANPSIYKFEWGGGNLTIEEELGNNGSGHLIDVELAASGVTLNSDGSLSSNLASVTLPSGGPTAPTDVIVSMNLAAGTYVLDTYLGTCAPGNTCTGGSASDPQYQVLFTPVSATPIPAALPLFATGLGALGLVGWRRKRPARSVVAV
jgi:hypothetical protein